MKGAIIVIHKRDESDKASAALNQIFEIINAKGDEGELKQIAENTDTAIKKDREETLE